MRRFFSSAVPLLALLLCAAGVLLTASPVFAGGTGYEFYLGDSSSARIVLSRDPVLDKLRLPGIRGESVRYEGDCYEALKERFRAELVFTEETAGTTNYYLFSPLLGEGVLLAEGAVNLHVAVGENVTAAGTPLIFGGF